MKRQPTASHIRRLTRFCIKRSVNGETRAKCARPELQLQGRIDSALLELPTLRGGDGQKVGATAMNHIEAYMFSVSTLKLLFPSNAHRSFILVANSVENAVTQRNAT